MSKDQASQEAKEMMSIQEGADGGAVVDLPESIQSPQVQAGEESDASDEAAERREIEETGEVDPDMDEMRAAKRNKRRAKKDYHRQVEVEKDVKLNHLTRQNQDLLERLSSLEQKSHGSEIARINKAIEDQESRIQYAKEKMSEATSTGNGNLLANAQEMWFEARRSHESLVNLKGRAVQPTRQNTIQAPDPILQRYASQWMTENPWYDPNGKDADSRRALNEDKILADEGYDPKTQDYWDELTNRLQVRMPHRYNNEVEDVQHQRSRPKSVVTGSGRESVSRNSGGSNSFHLSPERVRAMKDGGYWEDPEKRAKMIRSYALADKQSNGDRR